MPKVPFQNKAKHNCHIGGVVVRPGETRFIEAREHPDYKPPIVAVVTQSYVQSLFELDTKDIKLALPDLSDEDLGQLEALEKARKPKPRKGVMEAIAAEQLDRAAGDPTQAELDAAAFVESLPGIDQDELLQLALDTEDEGQKALIAGELQRREEASE